MNYDTICKMYGLEYAGDDASENRVTLWDTTHGGDMLNIEIYAAGGHYAVAYYTYNDGKLFAPTADVSADGLAAEIGKVLAAWRRRKALVFEGAGAANSRTDVGNCRLRTAFHRTDGRGVYLELLEWDIRHWCQKMRQAPADLKAAVKAGMKYAISVDFAFYVDYKDCKYFAEFAVSATKRFRPYSKSGILELVHELGGDFTDIEVENDGYRVFDDKLNYVYGDR